MICFIPLGASRPIRRGKIFSNNQPQKKSFFRHFKKFQLIMYKRVLNLFHMSKKRCLFPTFSRDIVRSRFML